jgi:hypothetical protein
MDFNYKESGAFRISFSLVFLSTMPASPGSRRPRVAIQSQIGAPPPFVAAIGFRMCAIERQTVKLNCYPVRRFA